MVYVVEGMPRGMAWGGHAAHPSAMSLTPISRMKIHVMSTEAFSRRVANVTDMPS